MKKKYIIKVKRSKVAKAFFYIQLAIVSPILLPLIAVHLLTEEVLNVWVGYKNWYLKKTATR